MAEITPEQTEGPRDSFPERAGIIHWVAWPSPDAAQYWLGHGSLPGPPPWGLVTTDGAPDQLWRTRGVTVAALREWLLPLANPEAAESMAAAFASTHPDLFAKP